MFRSSARSAVLRLAIGFAGVAAIAAYIVFATGRDPLAGISSAIRRTGRRPTTARIVGMAYGHPPASRTAQVSGLSSRAAMVLREKNADRHSAAIALLTAGRREKAIFDLESLTNDHRDNAHYWSDLAAARFEDAAARSDVHTHVSALAAADRALRLDPHVLEALFNRAIILDAIGLRADAATACRRYLTADSTSSWAVEIRALLQRNSAPTRTSEWRQAIGVIADAVERKDWTVVRQITLRFPQQARAYAEAEFLGRWADAVRAGQAGDAERWLATSRAIGSFLRQKSGEALLADSVSVIDGADLAQKNRLAAAYDTYRAGRMTYAKRDVYHAIPLLREAEHRFRAERSPMRFNAALFLANALVDSNQLVSAAEIASRLSREAPAAYLALRSQLRWVRGPIAGLEGRPFEALIEYRAATAQFDRLGEIENAARTRSACASTLAFMGQDAEAWRLCSQILRDITAGGIPWDIEVMLNGVARQEISGKRFDNARSLLQLQLTQKLSNPRLRFDALMWLAFVDHQLFGPALDFRRARAAALDIADSSLRKGALDELRFVEAVHQTNDPAQAVALLSETINYRLSVKKEIFAGFAYVERARAYRRLGQAAMAESDLRRAIAIVEAASTDVADQQLRDSYFGTSRDAFDELTGLLVERGRVAQAFEVADRGRARVISDRASNRSFSIADLQRKIRPGTVVAHYTALNDRLLIMGVRRDTWNASAVRVSSENLLKAKDRFHKAIASNAPREIEAAGAILHDILIAPLGDLAGTDTIVIVPDEITSDIAFAALRTPRRKWLVEEAAVAIAPAAAAYDGEPVMGNRLRAAFIADPAFDRTIFPELQSLPAARGEISHVKGALSGVRPLIGEEATRANITTALKNSEFVHIAAHAVSDRRDASRSFIPLAPADDDNGILYSHEIATLPLERVSCVVLAGCQTGARGGGLGSIRSLGLSFLAGGAHSVVATLWNVGDVAASEMTRDFYDALPSAGAPTVALRRAQLDAIARGETPGYWAGFQILIAGGGEFQRR